MNKLQLFTRYYITKVERGMDQSRSKRGFEFVNEKTFSNEEFVWRRSTGNNLKIIKRGGVTSAIKMGKDTRRWILWWDCCFYYMLEEKHPNVEKLVCASDGPFGPNTLRNSNDT